MLIVPDVMEHLKHHFIKSNEDKKGKLKYGWIVKYVRDADVRKYTETSVEVIAQVSRLPRKTAIGLDRICLS
jgi:hypothetical protein